MDTEKLLRVLNDARNDEKGLGISAKIDEVRNLLAQNNPTGFGSAHEKLTALILLAEGSAVFDFRPTESSLLETVGGAAYFGQGLVGKLREVAETRSFEQMGKLDEYRAARTAFVSKMDKLVTSLNELGVKEYRPEEWEVGITLPDEAADADKLVSVLTDLRKLFVVLAEASGETTAPIKITRAGNGTIELFSLQSVGVAVLFTTLLNNVGDIWEKIGKLKNEKEEVSKKNHFDKDTKDGVHKLIDEQIKKLRDEITNEMPDRIMKAAKVKLKDDRSNEVRNQIRASLKVVLAWLQVGIELEVTPVRVQETKTAEGAPDAKEVELLATASKTNFKLREIYKLPPAVRALPPGLLSESESPVNPPAQGKTKEDAGNDTTA